MYFKMHINKHFFFLQTLLYFQTTICFFLYTMDFLDVEQRLAHKGQDDTHLFL